MAYVRQGDIGDTALIVNTAAHTAVDKARSEPELVRIVNARALGGNFAKPMLGLAQQQEQEQEQQSLTDDQFGAPTGAELIADISAHAILQMLQRLQDNSLCSLSAQGETICNRYAKHVVAQDRRSQTAIKIAANDVMPVLVSAFSAPFLRSAAAA